MDPTAGTISRTARVSVVRLNLKEAAGKTPARRIGIAGMDRQKSADGIVGLSAGLTAVAHGGIPGLLTCMHVI